MLFKIRIYMPPKLSDFAQLPSSRPRITHRQTGLFHIVPLLCARGAQSPHWGNVMVLADSESKTEPPDWDLLSHPGNSSKCSMALRLGSRWSHGPIYIIAISRVVTCKDTYGPIYIHEVNCHMKCTPGICHWECRKDHIIRHMWGPLSFSFVRIRNIFIVVWKCVLEKKKKL